MPPEIGAAGRGGRALALVAEVDAAAREIVRRDLDDHPVADAGADAELAHLARHIGENLVLVIERHAIIAVGQDLGHGAVEFEQLFLGHVLFSNPMFFSNPMRNYRGARWAALAPE